MSPTPSRPWRWTFAAGLLFLVAIPLRFHELLGEDWSLVGLAIQRGDDPAQPPPLWFHDLRFVVWLVSRNAYTLLHHPGRLFQAEPCAPVENALALGEPGLTLGLLGVPGLVWSGDPFVTYYTASFATVWIGAFAMFLLVRRWTGSPVAGLVAGLLYGLHPIKTANIVHPYVVDTGWTVLAMYFATRLFETGRLRDGLGAGLCTAAQIGGSLYPLLGAVTLAVPLLAWLAWSRGFERLTWGGVGLALAIPLAAAAFVYAPYLAVQAESAPIQFYLAWSSLLPGQRLFPGWTFLLLAVAGAGLSLGTHRSSPRVALLVGAACAAYLAAGGNAQHVVAGLRGEPVGVALPNLFRWLATWVPGLELVRAPASLHVAVHLAVGALAGLGAAALLLRTPGRWKPAASALLVLLAAGVALEPPLPGVERRLDFVAVRLAPETDELELYRALSPAGETGAIFDAPMARGALGPRSEAVLHAAYHHRRTSACAASLRPPATEAVEHIGERLPSPDAVRALAVLGFTSVVLQHTPQSASHLRARWVRESEGLLAERFQARRRTGWSIAPAARTAEATRTRPPNLVLVIGDDHAWDDAGFMGSDAVRTPNLDRLAADGLVFSHGFNTATTCRPSLLTLLTGLHPFQLRPLVGVGGGQLPRSGVAVRGFDALPARLAERGYMSFQGGKYWEGGYADAGFTHGVTTEQRFPLGVGRAASAIGRRTMQPVWDFLDAHHREPFFLWFAPTLPHQPYDAGPEFRDLYAPDDALRGYRANVTRMDARLGELLERLEALGVRDDTVVVYVSDNGRAHPAGADAGKGSHAESGYRTPIVFSGPGVLASGERDARLVSTVDLYLTLLDLAGAPLPPGRLGASLAPRLRGAGGAERQSVFGSARRRALGGPPAASPESPGHEVWFYRTPSWRLRWDPASGENRLFRIEEDPREERELSAEHPEVVAELHRALATEIERAAEVSAGLRASAAR